MNTEGKAATYLILILAAAHAPIDAQYIGADASLDKPCDIAVFSERVRQLIALGPRGLLNAGP